MNTIQRLADLALMLLLCATASLAQTTIEINPPYNPDANDDGAVGSTDLMGLLAVFGFDFTTESIFVDGMTLEEYLLELTAWMTELEGQISSSTTTSFGVTDVIVTPDNTLQFTFSDGTTLDTPLLVGPAGLQGEPGPAGPAGPTGPQGPEGDSTFPAGTDLAPGTILVWNGSEWDTVVLFGCTDARFSSYNSAAAIDDGSCVDLIGCTSSDVISFDGHDYSIVTIGDQCWFKENLRSEHYANGETIPIGLTDSSWQNTMSGAMAVYNDAPGSLETYGRLYNWYAVADSRGLCPSGWHAPTNGEWVGLGNHLGSSAGYQMRSSPSDSPSWDGSNSSGFSALPGGIRNLNGVFDYEGFWAYFWSSSLNGSTAWYVSLPSDVSFHNRLSNGNLRSGFSVRCVRD